MRDSRTNGSGVVGEMASPLADLSYCAAQTSQAVKVTGKIGTCVRSNEEIGGDGELLLGALNPVVKLADMYRSCPTAVPLPVIHSIRRFLHTHVELPGTCPRHARLALWEG